MFSMDPFLSVGYYWGGSRRAESRWGVWGFDAVGRSLALLVYRGQGSWWRLREDEWTVVQQRILQ